MSFLGSHSTLYTLGASNDKNVPHSPDVSPIHSLNKMTSTDLPKLEQEVMLKLVCH